MTTGVLPSRQRPILVTGGTGFVGSAVMHALTAPGTPGQGPELRLLSRRPLPARLVDAGVVGVHGDLTEPSTLRGMCDGVATIVHLASQIGGDPGLCFAVNADGTRAVLDEAQRSGVRRVLYVGTTSIYGDGPHRGIRESLIAPAPASPTSRSRLAAERAVRIVGGTVLRPHLTYGSGDSWFLPNLLRMLQHVPAWIDGGVALTSLVAVDDLARVVSALARMPWGPSRGSVFHVSHPQPISMRALIGMVCGQLGLPLPEHDLPAGVHRALTRRALAELTDHQYSLLAVDHWYDSRRIWHHVGVAPGCTPIHRLAGAAPWYRRQQAGATAACPPLSPGTSPTPARLVATRLPPCLWGPAGVAPVD